MTDLESATRARIVEIAMRALKGCYLHQGHFGDTVAGMVADALMNEMPVLQSVHEYGLRWRKPEEPRSPGYVVWELLQQGWGRGDAEPALWVGMECGALVRDLNADLTLSTDPAKLRRYYEWQVKRLTENLGKWVRSDDRDTTRALDLARARLDALDHVRTAQDYRDAVIDDGLYVTWPKPIVKVETAEEHARACERISDLMTAKDGEDLAELNRLALLVEAYEERVAAGERS